ncbi:MAG: hypothetical protein HYU86_07095 [Chloroflexi bacterium]|nr:hypothetical protein [Chloroflexota bacterium]
MDINQLKNYLDSLSESLKGADKKLLNARVKSLVSAFPFSEYEYILMFLLDRRVIAFDDYEKLRNEYVSSNRYLDLYGLAPRIFGEIWTHEHIMDLDRRFIRPNKSVDPDYDGEYDLWTENTRLEIKAARAINTKKRGSLLSKALRYTSEEPFWMNFQQIKLEACDVFVFVGVWVDQIVYWVLSPEEAKNNRHLSHQHRGGIEYQIGITDKNIRDFDQYGVKPSEIRDVVLQKGKRR